MGTKLTVRDVVSREFQAKQYHQYLLRRVKDEFIPKLREVADPKPFQAETFGDRITTKVLQLLKIRTVNDVPGWNIGAYFIDVEGFVYHVGPLFPTGEWRVRLNELHDFDETLIINGVGRFIARHTND